MTNLEKLKQDHPELSEFELGLTIGTKCPEDFGYTEDETIHCTFDDESCTKCWSQQYVEKFKKNDTLKEDIDNVDLPREVIDQALEKAKEWAKDAPDIIVEIPELDKPVILDSGNRTEFGTGAVRDMREGKGRCDLVPMEVMSRYVYGDGSNSDPILDNIDQFQKTRGSKYLYMAIEEFDRRHWSNRYTLCLEVAKHFEEGAKKYGPDNWRRGIPVYCYIDSAVRHYLKWLRRDGDEPHDRAFVWNLMCCIWEVDYHKTTVDEVDP